jgi:hypothetical protein
MKQFLLVLACMFNLQLHAQSVIDINNTKADEGPFRMKHNTRVKFRINHVNPFKLQASSEAVKQSFTAEVPMQFTSALPETQEAVKEQIAISSKELVETLVTFTNAPKSKKSQLKKKIQEDSTKLAYLQKVASLQEDFIEHYSSFIAAANKISRYAALQPYIDSLLDVTYVPDVATFKANLENYMKSISDDPNDINSIRKSCTEAFEDLFHHYMQARAAYELLSKQINEENVEVTGQLASKNKEVEVKVKSADIRIVLKKYFENEFLQMTARFNALSEKRTLIGHMVNDGVSRYFEVQASEFAVYTDSETLDEDVVEITPKLKNAKGEVIKEFNPVKISTVGGVKVDFSTGYLLSFRGDENYTNRYDETGAAGVQKSGSDDLKHALGALVHVYRRNTGRLTYGGSVGFSIPVDGSRIGFYAGPSILMLEKHRLVFTAGIAYNSVKVLNTSNLAADGKYYKFTNADFREIKYDDVYRPAFFLGITYNIFSIKK